MINKIEHKIVSLSAAKRQVEQWRSNQNKIVWTNGVFDLLHPGHIRYLCSAKDLGDFLVVGINSDDSVRRLKGPGRPVNREANRLLQMAALLMVDLVVLFREDTPINCILELQPDIIAKGGDYREGDVVGGKEAKSWSGSVVILPFESGHSTSSIIEKIQRKSHED